VVKVEPVARGSGQSEYLPLQLRFKTDRQERFLSALTMTTSILHNAGALPLPARVVSPADREGRNYCLAEASIAAHSIMTQLHPLASSFPPQFEGPAASSSSSSSSRRDIMQAVNIFTDETDV